MRESFFASVKGELIDLQPRPTRAAARRATAEYISWYDGTRCTAMAALEREGLFSVAAHEWRVCGSEAHTLRRSS
jgi:Integrase core domain